MVCWLETVIKERAVFIINAGTVLLCIKEQLCLVQFFISCYHMTDKNFILWKGYWMKWKVYIAPCRLHYLQGIFIANIVAT